MKVKSLITQLLKFDMDAEVMVSIGNTFDDVSDFSLSWGGSNSKDGDTSKDAEFIYINFMDNVEYEIKDEQKECLKIKITQEVLDYITKNKPKFENEVNIGEEWDVDEIRTYPNVNNGLPVVEVTRGKSWMRLPKDIVELYT